MRLDEIASFIQLQFAGLRMQLTQLNLRCHDSSASGLVSVGPGLSMLSLSRMAGHPATARMMVLAAKVAAPTMPLTSTEQDTLKALVSLASAWWLAVMLSVLVRKVVPQVFYCVLSLRCLNGVDADVPIKMPKKIVTQGFALRPG